MSRKRYDAKATPQHNVTINYEPREGDAPVWGADPAIGVGERCRLNRKAKFEDGGSVKWHAAVTHQGCEGAVRAELQARGIDTVLPMVRYWHIRRRQRIVVERPLLASVVLFALDHTRQSLVDMFDRFEWDSEQQCLRKAHGPQVAVPVPGIERIVRGASDRWAVLPTEQVWDLRLSILRGDFDATLREEMPNVELPPIIRWLLKNGDLPPTAILTHKEARRKGLKFNLAA